MTASGSLSRCEPWRGHNIDAICVESLTKNIVDDAISMINSKPISSGKYKILLDKRAASNLFSTFRSMFNANRIQKGFSVFKNKLGQAVASTCITIRDEPLLPLLSGSCSFDDEGCATKNEVVVENGVLLTLLHNMESAKQDGVKSTGNGFKKTFRSFIDIAPTNLYIVPSCESFDDLLLEMHSGLVVRHLESLHSSINVVSGDFSLPCSGYLFKNGEIVHPVEEMIISGNFYELIKQIIKVANDIEHDFYYIASPALWIASLYVSN